MIDIIKNYVEIIVHILFGCTTTVKLPFESSENY